MSHSVLCGRGRHVITQAAAYQALTALCIGRTRNFSAASSDEPYVTISPSDAGPRTVWPDEHMGPFGPQDRRFQLPGNVGFDCHLEGVTREIKLPSPPKTLPEFLTAPSGSERHQLILAQFVRDFQDKLGPISSRVHKAEQYFSPAGTDCAVSSCPELLWKELEPLFPSTPANAITVVTVTQKSDQNEEEEKKEEEAAAAAATTAEMDHEQQLKKFVSGAKEMCFSLWTAGYWADFIDPTTGEAFFASPFHESSLQTEEDLRHLGFHIEASGSCTVIRHVLKGASLFVGTVFTNAPAHSTAIARLRGLSKGRDEED